MPLWDPRPFGATIIYNPATCHSILIARHHCIFIITSFRTKNFVGALILWTGVTPPPPPENSERDRSESQVVTLQPTTTLNQNSLLCRSRARI